jgi:CheY-like chemotaxis protein
MGVMTNTSPQTNPTVTTAAGLDVLFVDDDQDIADLMTEYLRRCGYKAESATNGQTALKKLRGREVAVLVTDILMPELDGYELIMKLKQRPQRPTIIAASGNASSIGMDFLKSARQLGADRVLPKPYLPTTLLAQVREILGPRTPLPATGT